MGKEQICREYFMSVDRDYSEKQGAPLRIATTNPPFSLLLIN